MTGPALRLHPALPRHLHAGAWWVWALGLATAASRTTDPLLLAMLAAVAGYVVAARRSEAPWARAYSTFLILGAVVIVLRLLFEVLLGPEIDGHLLFTLPQAHLPSWAAGVRLGGPVTLEALLGALFDGLQLAVLIACVGAANSLANPARLLKSLPGALYEMGVAVVVALSFAPNAVTSLRRVRVARRLRGRPDRGLAGVSGLVIPVLEDAVGRSIEMAASMDSRGYGRRAGVDRWTRRVTAVLVVTGLFGICIGVYGLLDSSTPSWLGAPALGIGAVLAGCGLVAGGRRTTRSRYRPDPWRASEWLVACAGVLTAVAFVAAGGDPALHPATSPIAVPGLPLLPLLGVALAATPAWLAPRPPDPMRAAAPVADRHRTAAPAR